MLAKGGKYNLLMARSVVIFTAVIICGVFYQSYISKSETYISLNTRLNSETKRFKTLSDKTLLVAEYENEFKKYQPIEQYETENRLYWLDSLDKIRVKYKIPKLTYSISKQQPYNYKDKLINQRGLKVKVSEIKLSMNLMHEGDLVSVVRDLNNIKSSLHVVNSCELERLSNKQKSAARPNIKATCFIKWFTFKVNK